MPRGVKRNMDWEESLAEHSSQHTSFADLPDEMHVAIFVRLDSVTRKVIERVCRRWMALLRQTHSLQVYVKIDVGILLAIPTVQPVPITKLDYETQQGTPKQRRLIDTIRRFMQGNQTVETFHLTDESNPAKPWMSDVIVPPGDEECFGQLVLNNMCMILFPVVDEDEEDARRLPRLILEKLVLSATDLRETYFLNGGYPVQLRIVELWDVKVRQMSMERMSPCPRRNRNPYDFDRHMEMTRTIASGTIAYDDDPMSQTAPMAQFYKIVGQNDEPLTLEEEERYRQVASPGQHDDAKYRIRLSCVFDYRNVTMEDIVDGSTLTHFEKRLVAGTTRPVAWWVSLAVMAADDENENEDVANDMIEHEGEDL